MNTMTMRVNRSRRLRAKRVLMERALGILDKACMNCLHLNSNFHCGLHDKNISKNKNGIGTT